MYVGDYMTTDLTTARCNEPVREISRTMHRRGIHQVPVVDESGRLAGIVTDRDIRSAIGYGDANLELALVAEDVMTADVATLLPDEELIRAVEVLRDRRIGGLPVTQSGKVVGIITKHDLLRRLHEMLREEAGDPSARRSRTAGRSAGV